MPYEIVREPRGAYKRFWGVVTPDEFLESVSKFHNDRFFETIRYTINDFSAAERFELSDTHIVDTASINIGSTYTNPNVSILAVTISPMIIGMAKKYDQLTNTAPILIFSTLEQARAWIAENVRV